MTEIDLSKLSDEDLIRVYPQIIKLLKERKIIHSKNLIGELGEYMAISHYCNTKGLPNLQRAPPTTKNIDAISRDGERYSIKATSTSTTGTFFGLNSPDSNDEDKQRFEYVIIVIFDDNYNLEKIIEIDWKQFLQMKRWDSRMNAWNIPVNNRLKKTGKIVFQNQKSSS